MSRPRNFLKYGFHLLALALAGAAPFASAEGQSKPPRELASMALMLNPSGNTIVVSWLAVQKATEYELDRCEGAGLTTCTVKTNPRVTSGQPFQVTDNVTVSGTYLYRITAFNSRGIPIAGNQVAWLYTAPVTAVVMPAPTGTITPIRAGPSQLTAASTIPGQIRLSWTTVPDAIGFKVFRSNSGGEVNREIPGTGKDAYGNLIIAKTDGPVDFRWTYTYTVYARFQSGTSEFLSAASPQASAKSVPFVQVSGLTYTIVPSVKSPGNLDLTMQWNAVNGAYKYIVTDKDYSYVQAEIPGTSAPVFKWLIGTRTSYTMCVGVEYLYNIRQPATEPCVTIKT
jgi:hypothetical protein